MTAVRDGSDPVQAIAALEARLAATPKATRPHEHAAAAYRLGLARAESPVGDPAENLRAALSSYDVAASIFDPRHDPVEHARVLNAAGAAHRALGHPNKAADLFGQAATLLDTGDNDHERAAALNNLGLVRAELGQRADAVTAFDEAAGLFDIESPDGRRGRASALHNRGLVRAAAGSADDLRAAIEDHQEARDAVEREEAPYHHALVEHSIGVVATGLADLEPASRGEHLAVAIEAFSSALDMFTRSGFPFQHALASHNLGRALAATGDLVDLRRAVACFEDAVSVLDPRMHAEPWRHAHASLESAEAELSRHTGGGTVHRAASFAELVGEVSPSERMLLLRGRLGRLLTLPAQARDAAFAELANASANLPEEAALGYMTAELGVLMELPNEGLEAALAIRVATHQRLDPERMLTADRALDQAVGDALGLSQRLLVREHLESLGFERP